MLEVFNMQLHNSVSLTPDKQLLLSVAKFLILQQKMVLSQAAGVTSVVGKLFKHIDEPHIALLVQYHLLKSKPTVMVDDKLGLWVFNKE